MPPVNRPPLLSTLSSLSTPRPRVRLRQRPPSRFICPSCLLRRQPLSTTTILHKKTSASKKSSRREPDVPTPNITQHVPDNKATRARDAEVDPYDHSALESGIAHALARLKDALTKTRDAGRVSTAMLDDLPVELNLKGADTKGAPAHKQHARLGDLAAVVPRGARTMHVFAAEPPHVKPLLAALQASPYSLAPSATDAHNPLLIHVPVPPVTQETRAQAAHEAKKCLERCLLEIRNARGESQKRFRKMELQKLVIKDELRKAHDGMERVVKKGEEEARKVHDNAVRALER